ncbi:MAG: Uma2 family endonuclease [Candidatus Sericytochromatia bacterium]
MGLPATRSNACYTYQDYLSWPDSERWEIIEGTAYVKEGGLQAMSPAPSRRHQAVQGALFFQIYAFLRGQRCQVYTAPLDVCLKLSAQAEETTVVQPDILVVCDPLKLTDRGCQGSPDWIIEVVSPGSAAMDYVKKLNLYERFGVKEYWVVHPHEETIMVFVLNAEGKYQRPQTYTSDSQVGVTLFKQALVIDFATIFGEAAGD